MSLTVGQIAAQLARAGLPDAPLVIRLDNGGDIEEIVVEEATILVEGDVVVLAMALGDD